ncbi:MAG TPA: hypothetical protein DD640_10735, partial [Clostridiales bacterium]|nr:hypothetical protein [Clostridiales bacterium]
VHVADRHTSPGKKMFTWAYNQLSRSWEKALTDTDGPYAELMAGSYSDNQPDFAWLAPYETKEFEQCWYPISGLGAPVMANRQAAVSLNRREGLLTVRLQSTQPMPKCRLILSAGDGSAVCLDQTLDLQPAQVSAAECPDPPKPVVFQLLDQKGRIVLEYREEKPDSTDAPANPETLPEAWQDLPGPEEAASVQDLYLMGVHVRQYRDPCAAPDVYWQEALRRDPAHLPTLLAMGEYRYLQADFSEALDHLQEARRIITRFNGNPADGQVFYWLGLVYEALGREDADRENDAENAFAKAAWSAAWRSPALTRLACLAGRRGNYQRMLDYCRETLAGDPRNGLIQALQAAALVRLGLCADAGRQLEQALAADPLNQLARYLDTRLREMPLSSFISSLQGDRGQTGLDLAFDLLAAGLTAEAAELLQSLLDADTADSRPTEPMVAYVLTSLALSGAKTPEPADRYLELAENGAIRTAYPFRLNELTVLRKVTVARPRAAKAWCYLGCLLYGKRHYAKAADCWTRAADLDTQSSLPRRNLAIACYSHLGRRDETLPLLREAYTRDPDNEQLLYEICSVMGRTGVPPQERIAFIASHAAGEPRPEIVLEWTQALNQAGRYEEALNLLASHRFVPCEGGEHAVAEQYLFARHAIGRCLLQQNRPADALEQFRLAQVLPDNLGAGLWHEALLVPHQFYEAFCLDLLNCQEDASQIYRHIAGLSVDYFSNMHLPALPYWQALSLNRLGQDEASRAVLAAAEERWQEALLKKSAGYFKATPFFINYMESPENQRRGLYQYLLGLARLACGNREDARACLQESQTADPTMLSCKLELDLLKGQSS